ncbi:sugar transferase [Bacillus carboniphilus]|uniref:Sugar transferase n=1 Tax=Bacillus carboniphilus TaxID=86663 RepID=A0ABY9JZL9_9BACI|nr:sugar transferase [Bacillus carboniphilus]WLR44219.1 sugar transferase [Bacillus carboniphilus]
MTLKRIFDIVVSSLLLIFLSPIFLFITVLIIFHLGSPVIFKQSRVGKNEQVFTLFKFRSMTDYRNDRGELLSDEERLPSFGKWLRKSSLDEIPQLINVLKGDVSLVGPRPLLVEYLPLYTKEQHRRHEVRPGITGWAQINGRNNITWEEKFSLDVWYVEHHSLLLDLKIIFKTVSKIVKKEGISQEGKVTVEKFKGLR